MLTAGISETVDLFNKRRARYTVGSILYCAAIWQLALFRQSVLTQVFSALVRYHTQEQQVALDPQRLLLLKCFVTQAVDAKTHLLFEKQNLMA